MHPTLDVRGPFRQHVPCVIAVDQRIDLPKPRSYREPRFLEYRFQLLSALGVEETA